MIEEQARCPVTGLGETFNPFIDPYLADPYEFYKQARKEEPVFYSPELDYWVINRYEDVRQVFKDHESFSAEIALSPITPFSDAMMQVLKEGGFKSIPSLANNVPPGHSRIREHAYKAFTPRRIAKLEPHIRQIVTDRIDQVQKAGQAEMVSALTYDLPALILFILMGITDEDALQIKEWAGNRIQTFWGRPTPEEQIEQAHLIIVGYACCLPRICAEFFAAA